MGKIFISYSRQDWAYAKVLADELERQGYSVWWDEKLFVGSFRDQIAKHLNEAKAVIVVWSVDSALSEWVREEAGQARRVGKLIQTRLPGMSATEIPMGFGEDQTEFVTNLEKIKLALTGLELLPDPARTQEGAGTFADKMSEVMKAHQPVGAEGSSAFLPVVTLLVSLFLGVAGIIAAMLIGVGFVKWDPQVVDGVEWAGPKQVGYVPALNWSVSTVLLVPLALMLVLMASQELVHVRRLMVKRKMIVSADFEPLRQDDRRIERMWRAVRRVTKWCMIGVTTLMLIFAMVDYVAVVDSVYHNEKVRGRINVVSPNGGYTLDDVTMERDWSLAALLRRSDAKETVPVLNRVFALFVYVVYAGIGVGILFSFFVALFGVGMFFIPEVARNYGLLVIPDLTSQDRRRGFELLGPFFSRTISVAALCLMLCYLMTLQNIYLRVPARTLVEFLMPYPGDAISLWQAGKLGQATDALVGHIGYVPGNSMQSLLAWFVASFMVVAVLGVAFLFLRSSALQGRSRLQMEWAQFGTQRLIRIAPVDAEGQALENLQSLRAWPLLWPSLNATMFSTFLIIASFVFYKLGIAIMLLSLGFVIHNTFRSFR